MLKQFLFLFLFPLAFLSGAEVDMRFFNDQNKTIYIESYQKLIKDETDPTRKEVISKLLGKIFLIDQKNDYLTLDLVHKNEKLNITTVKKMLHNIVTLTIQKQQLLEKKEQAKQNKAFIHSEIENIIIENKHKLPVYQLQFTMYHLLISKLKQQISDVEKTVLEQTNILKTTLEQKLHSEDKSYKNNYALVKEKIVKLEKQRMEINSQLEISSLIESLDLKKLTQELDALNKTIQITHDQQFDNLINLIIYAIYKENKQTYANKLNELSLFVNSNEEKLMFQELKNLAKNKFGIATSAILTYKESFFDSVLYVLKLFSEPLFIYNEKPVTFADILKVIIIILLGFTLASLYRRKINSMIDKWEKASPMTIKLTANLGYYFIIFITIIIALSTIGIDLTSVSMLASALAIGIGFGLQTVVSNMVAGIILMFERSIRVGDFIEISTDVVGQVTDMRIRSTTVKTFDNVDIVVPNSTFIQNNVVNLTLYDRTRRMHIPFGVAYGTQIDKVQKAVLDEVAISNLLYISNDPDKEPAVRMVGMNNSSVDFELLVWIEWHGQKRPMSVKSDFLILIYNALYKNNIEIPFPQLDLHVKHLPNTSMNIN